MEDLFRRQFLLAPKKCQQTFLNDWLQLRIGGYFLYVHPLMGMEKNQLNQKEIVLLGFAYHCLHPEWTKSEIINNLLNRGSYLSFIEGLDELSGNYVILYRDLNNFAIYHDPGSCAKVFYKLQPEKPVIGSDPKILQLATQLEYDHSQAALEYYNSGFFKKNKKWVGDLTWYQNVYQLLPNHRFIVDNQNIERFFPRGLNKSISFQKGVEDCSYLFNNLLRACSQNHEIFVSLTAGWDSRVVASITHPICEKAEYYAFQKNHQKRHFPDIEIPNKICRDLNLKFNLIQVKEDFSAPDHKQFFNSYELSSWQNMKMINQVFQKFPENANVLLGLVSEIGKNYFEGVRINNGFELRKALHFPNLKYTNDYFIRWYEHNYKELKSEKYEPLDIAHWEQDIANFAGQIVFRLNYATKVYSLFNCRLLLGKILAVPPKYRDKHHNKFYKTIILKNWPSLLKYPVNPFLRTRIIELSKKLRIYKLYRQLMVKWGGK